MGAALGDLDGDGLIDLGVSASPEHYLFQGQRTGLLLDRSEIPNYFMLDSPTGARMLPWGVAFVDVDQDGWSDIVTAHGIDVRSGLPEHPDPEHCTIHWNAGALRFAEITAAVNIGRPGQWHGLSVADIDGDGAADLLVGAQGELPRVYRNAIAAGNHGFALRLHGTSSNHLGVGSHIEVQATPGAPTRSYFAGGIASANVVTEPLVFVGLGTASTASLLRITWPSGTVQTLRDVPSGGMITVEEPPIIALSPSGRHVRAGGAAALDVRVTPRDERGAVRANAVPVLAMTTAGTRIVVPLVRDADGWNAAITSPTTAGSSVFDLQVDGVKVTVHPRVWWDPP